MSPDRIVQVLDDGKRPPRPAIVGARLASILLLVLTLMVPVTGVIAVQALRTANTAACRGANDAKSAVVSLFHTIVANAERPIPNATPEALARQKASLAAYERFRKLTDAKLANTPGC
ncbi:MAG TPA: hypothetical protein VNM39_13405 [Verrucomicrobiae bacterium]|nr:hypothetical protein [Verrucomicrobiae bacterium]